MAGIFLSYRRTDGPQACRVHDWLVRRFGDDAVFMDVSGIPIAVQFPDFIRNAIASSQLLVALIGTDWEAKMREPGDPVRIELEAAKAAGIRILPVLIGNTAMPEGEGLPESVREIAYQNAPRVGVLHDFDSHMRSLMPRVEEILAAAAARNAAISEPDVIERACKGIVRFLEKTAGMPDFFCRWTMAGSGDFGYMADDGVKLYLHRVVRLADCLELHFLLSFFFRDGGMEQRFAGSVMYQFERNPFVPEDSYGWPGSDPGWTVKVRPSDEDARQIWKMITPEPLRLSLAYVATVSPKRCA